MGDDPVPTNPQAKLAETFMTSFILKKNDLSTAIEGLKLNNDVALAGDINEKLTNILNGIQNLSKLLHDASLFLPSYSVKMRQNEIRDLEKALKDKEDELIPKTKFGFKSKSKDKMSCNILSGTEKSNTSTPLHNVIDSTMKTAEDSNFVTIENLEHTSTIYDDERVSKTDVLLRNLTGVIIELHGSPSTLRISNIKNCKILCGPVHTSVFVEDASDSVLFLCCQQLRTHGSKNTDIYLRVRSRAIIEECSGIRFAPYTWDHPLSKLLHEGTHIDPNLQRFDVVDDFNWLSASHSPNWCVIPVEERIIFPSLLQKV